MSERFDYDGLLEVNQTLSAENARLKEALREASDLIKLMPMLTAHNVAAVLDRLAREAQINFVASRN